MAKETYYRITIDRVEQDRTAENSYDRENALEIYKQVLPAGSFTPTRFREIVEAVNDLGQNISMSVDDAGIDLNPSPLAEDDE